jgi:hypothetical protein
MGDCDVSLVSNLVISILWQTSVCIAGMSMHKVYVCVQCSRGIPLQTMQYLAGLYYSPPEDARRVVSRRSPVKQAVNRERHSPSDGVLKRDMFASLHPQFRTNGRNRPSNGNNGLEDLGVLVAFEYGPISVVTPLTAAYPVVTLGFAAVALKEKTAGYQWICIVLILIWMFLSPGAS